MIEDEEYINESYYKGFRIFCKKSKLKKRQFNFLFLFWFKNLGKVAFVAIALLWVLISKAGIKTLLLLLTSSSNNVHLFGRRFAWMYSGGFCMIYFIHHGIIDK